jgi:regulatory protein
LAAQPPSIKARALRCLAMREHSRAELERKLLAQMLRARAAGASSSGIASGTSSGTSGGTSSGIARGTCSGIARGPSGDNAEDLHAARQRLREEIGTALDELAARGLLSDERTAEAVLAGPGRRLGNRRLKQTLLAKGLAPELVAATVAQSRATELDRARELWRRRFGAPAPDAAGRARQARFLAGRGFDAEVIRRLVKGLDEN